MSLPPGWGPVLRLCCVGRGHQDEKGKDWGGQGLGRAIVSKGYPGVPCFANFYRRFIRSLSKIAAPLTSILKTTAASPEGLPEATGKVREETGNEVGDGDRAKMGVVKLPGGKNSKNSTKVKNSAKSKVESPGTAPEARPFLTSGAKLAFTWLRQAFTEASILHHFDPERYIRIDTDASSYAIGRVFSELTSDQCPSGLDENCSKSIDVGQWYSGFFL